MTDDEMRDELRERLERAEALVTSLKDRAVTLSLRNESLWRALHTLVDFASTNPREDHASSATAAQLLAKHLDGLPWDAALAAVRPYLEIDVAEALNRAAGAVRHKALEACVHHTARSDRDLASAVASDIMERILDIEKDESAPGE